MVPLSVSLSLCPSVLPLCASVPLCEISLPALFAPLLSLRLCVEINPCSQPVTTYAPASPAAPTAHPQPSHSLPPATQTAQYPSTSPRPCSAQTINYDV